MDLLFGYLIIGAMVYWAIKAIQKAWREHHPPVVHGPNDHFHKPVLRWTDKTERYLETVHVCQCGDVLEDRPGPSGTLGSSV